MGCSLSSCRSSTSSTLKNRIRVVHLNGYVQDFEYPVTAGEVTGCRPEKQKQYLCTPAQLLMVSNSSFTSTRALRPDTILEAGHIYLLLPYSTLQPDVSPVDLATIAKKLTAKAKSAKSTTSSSSSSDHSHPPTPTHPRRSFRMPPWTPTLDTIREKSFNRRSESDLQQM